MTKIALAASRMPVLRGFRKTVTLENAEEGSS